MVEPTTAIFLGISVTLVVSSILLLYPTYAFAQNVMYERGVKLLAASLLALTLGWLTSDLVSYGIVDAPVLAVVDQAFFTAAGGIYLWATWEFASDFVRFEDDLEVGTPTGEDTGGFETAADGPQEGFDEHGG